MSEAFESIMRGLEEVKASRDNMRVAYKKPVNVVAFSCPKCKQIVYSRDKCDSHICYCGSVDCHGRLTEAAEKNKVAATEKSVITVDASLEELSRDFYYNGGHFGTIQPEKK
jgi:acetyl-CoA carboxylase beta subunit